MFKLPSNADDSHDLKPNPKVLNSESFKGENEEEMEQIDITINKIEVFFIILLYIKSISFPFINFTLIENGLNAI